MAIAITDAITTLATAEQRLGLQRTEAADFFPEWHLNLPDLTPTEQAELTTLRQRYLYQRAQGQLLEGTVLLLLVSSLLALAGFYDPPFRVRAEESVRLSLNNGEQQLQGRLDVLVLLDQLWVVVVESKQTTLSVWSALPQTLAYLNANPHPQPPSFGVMTNGDEFVVVKLAPSPTEAAIKVYALSRVFALFAMPQDLAEVLRIFKHLGSCLSTPPAPSSD